MTPAEIYWQNVLRDIVIRDAKQQPPNVRDAMLSFGCDALRAHQMPYAPASEVSLRAMKYRCQTRRPSK